MKLASERKRYTTVRVEQEAFDLLDKLCERLAQRSYAAMPEEMGGRGKPFKIDVIHAALRLMEQKMDAEDVGALAVDGAPAAPGTDSDVVGGFAAEAERPAGARKEKRNA